MAQAVGVGHQAAAGTAAAAVVWEENTTTANPTNQVGLDEPRAKNNSIWAHSQIKFSTRFIEFPIEVQPDNRDLGQLLIPPFGKPTSVSHVHTWRPGSDGTNTGSGLSTVLWQNPNVLDAGFGMIDSVGTAIRLVLDAAGNLRIQSTLRGRPIPIDSTPPAVSYDPLENSLLPFTPWLAYLQIDSADPPVCVRTLNLDINFNRDPLYCIPTAKWNHSTQVRGSVPTRFKHGDAVGTIEVTADFPQYASSFWQQFDNETETEWLLALEADDGATTPVPKSTWDLLRVKWTNPTLEDDGLESVQHMRGEILYDSGENTALIVALTNALTNYNGT